jgi:cellulose synthase/poly-beta-1,6-N-acetylglucosamine synthase-like glycosyltransferase
MTSADAESQGKSPELSVIIPSFNSRDKIVKCLDGLRSQRIDSPFEMIVVDSSDDGTGDMLSGIEDIVLVRSRERLYPGTARNRGAEAATGCVLCFIDADCVPSTDWLERILEADPEAGRTAVGGAVRNGTPESSVGTAEYFSELSGLLPGRPMREVEFLPGANTAVGASAFAEVGGYRDFEKGSDVTFGSDCRRRGIQPVFHPEIAVAHGNRTDFSGFASNQEKLGWGAGNNRVLYELPGSWLARNRIAWPLVPAARFSRIMLRGLRDGTGERWRLLKAAPHILVGSVRYGIGFARGVRDAEATRPRSHHA